ncbi:group III truncated hemoglobin [Lutimonas sp.]|uniref:group III truncated hemoglobin n=1 Tax=Lutimonas sp. TaxID=1872403 RepID=UPI003D9B8CD7
MNKDVTSREDLLTIVSDFYVDLLKSDELSHFFEAFKQKEVLKHHLDTLVDFWDNTLFYSGAYKKNAMKPHVAIHAKNEIQINHFSEWLQLFNKAVDSNFTGPNSETLKSRALSIATVMKLKLKVH